MELFKPLIRFFRLSHSDKEIITNDINLENIRRLLYLLLVAIPGTAAHIVIFGLKLGETTGVEHQWQLLIMISHSVLFISFTIISVLLYFFSFKPGKYNKLAIFSFNFIIFLLLIGGTVIASIDQLVTSAITPYLVTCLITGLIFLIRPLYSFFFYFFSYIILFYAIALVQTNPDILISNQVNGITATIIGMCLSFILWRGNMIRIKQRKMIEFQNFELKLRNSEKDKFFSIVAHDLKNPLSGIMRISEMMIEDSQECNKNEIEDNFRLINSTAESTYKLLENLLEWSMSQTGLMKYKPQNIDLAQLIKDKINDFSAAAKSKNISLKYFESTEFTVFADLNMLNTILRNLIANAIKYTGTDGTIEICSIQNAGFAEISVVDNGVGMEEDLISQLFQLTGGTSRKGTANEIGTGLGLVLCNELIKKQGGRIWAKSEPGKGSTFSFLIPLVGYC